MKPIKNKSSGTVNSRGRDEKPQASGIFYFSNYTTLSRGCHGGEQ
jgi:hypothetical protein